MEVLIKNTEYLKLLEQLKQKIQESRYKAVRTINSELIYLYHYIGTEILKRQAIQDWGSKVIDTISKDLGSEFPDMKGFSPTNLKYMKLFASEYSLDEIRQQAVDQLPWGHNILLMHSIKNKDERAWYIQKAIQYGWSRNVLSMQIETDLFKREGKALTNFKENLPRPYSDLAHQTLKDPYIFDFLTLGKEANEREIEKALMEHVEKFLLELGEGFAFLGRQYLIEIGGEEFRIDLLFYHVKLRAYIVIELKIGAFKPEYAGKMNLYLTAVDNQLKQPTDNPSIGLILCRSKNKIIVEYALKDINKPIGLAEYRLNESLPENLKTLLPPIEEIEKELSKIMSSTDELLQNNIKSIKNKVIAQSRFKKLEETIQLYFLNNLLGETKIRPVGVLPGNQMGIKMFFQAQETEEIKRLKGEGIIFEDNKENTYFIDPKLYDGAEFEEEN